MITKRLVSILMSLMCLLALPLTVQAAHATINTANGVVDTAGWSVAVTTTDGADYPDSNWDIQQAWVTNEADKSYFYFRVKLAGKMPANDWSGVEALLDCNADGDVADAVDVIVYFAPTIAGGTTTGACQGNQWPICNDFSNGPNAELIGTGPTDYEWKAPTTGLISYAACGGTMKVGFRTTYMTSETTYEFRDITTPINFYAPTRVTVNTFTADNTTFTPLALLGWLGVLALVVFILRRFPK